MSEVRNKSTARHLNSNKRKLKETSAHLRTLLLFLSRAPPIMIVIMINLSFRFGAERLCDRVRRLAIGDRRQTINMPLVTLRAKLYLRCPNEVRNFPTAKRSFISSSSCQTFVLSANNTKARLQNHFMSLPYCTWPGAQTFSSWPSENTFALLGL